MDFVKLKKNLPTREDTGKFWMDVKYWDHITLIQKKKKKKTVLEDLVRLIVPYFFYKSF